MLERARAKLAQWIAPEHTRKFDGASQGRRTFGAGTFGRVNSEVGAAGQALAARSAYLAANNPLIANAVGNIVGEAVGSGIRPSSDLVAEFDAWSDHADADGRTDFYGLQTIICTDVVVRGESFVLLSNDESGLTLRVLDVEQVDRSLTRDLGNGAQIVQGIEFDTSGNRVAYHISPARLTDTFASWAPPVRVDAADVQHIFRPLFPGQVRGVPWTAPIILSAGELDKLSDALLMGASVAAMFCGVVTDQNDLSSGEDPFGGEAQPSLEPGTLIRLKGGQSVTFATPQQSQAVAELLKVQIRQLAAGMGLPAFMVDGDLTGANYSSLRAGLLPFRRRIEAFQYHCLVPQLLAPVWRRWLATEGDADASARVEWIMPKPLQVDPQKDVEADLAELNAGLASRRQKVAARGWNAEQLDAEIAADRAREKRLGLTFGASPPSQKPETPTRSGVDE
ncbi:phage portal protein [Ancylobacter defluvii]|uniref:Phage portal protein n=1 Tax=Ancylobacter defluvii TaxID=1282440 RepID=A0A9W6JWW0_9HYPH|nr:phage portal protein [Ancylobacter defluvii]MBS7589053.1 phage portal protein [Ancylobacter defluvii]GLK84662.1 phage portal protein [Ancylobacter defluvii]